MSALGVAKARGSPAAGVAAPERVTVYRLSGALARLRIPSRQICQNWLSRQERILVQTRNQYIDALKGYAILMVVIGHSLQRAAALNLITVPAAMGNYPPYSGWVTMPLFFAISGFLCFGRVAPPRWKWLARKAQMLVIPWAAWTLVYYFLTRDPLWPNAMPLPQYAQTQLVSPSLWYFLMLFYIYVGIAICLTLGEWSLPVLGIALVVLKWPGAMAVEYYWWFLGGWYAARFCTLLLRMKWVLWGFTVPVYLWLLAQNPPAPSLRYQPVMALGAIGLATLIIWLVRKSALVGPLALMGQRTMDIYAGQFLFVQFAFVHSFLNVILTTVLAVVGSLVLGRILRSNRFTNAVFLGSRTAAKTRTTAST